MASAKFFAGPECKTPGGNFGLQPQCSPVGIPKPIGPQNRSCVVNTGCIQAVDIVGGDIVVTGPALVFVAFIVTRSAFTSPPIEPPPCPATYLITLDGDVAPGFVPTLAGPQALGFAVFPIPAGMHFIGLSVAHSGGKPENPCTESIEGGTILAIALCIGRTPIQPTIA